MDKPTKELCIGVIIVLLAGEAIVLFDVVGITFDVDVYAEAGMIVVLDAIGVLVMVVSAE